MKNSPLVNVLLGALAVSAVASVILCLLYIPNTRELRSLQGQMNNLNSKSTGVYYLGLEAVEYSKHNPAIDPILESVGLKPSRAAAAQTNKPAAK